MPRRDLRADLAGLASTRDDPTAPASLVLLRTALRGTSPHLAAAAAEIAGAAEVAALRDDLVAAFERGMSEPIKRDPGCVAKAAAADALYRLGAPEDGVFLRGIRHVQLEPVYGGRADTAVSLRGTCALALMRLQHRDALTAAAGLLADAEAPARRLAAQALAYGEPAAALPLLRFKALSGDADPQVLSECLLALLAIAPGDSLDFVAGFLDRRDAEVAEAAALALGGSRLRAALPLLTAWWEGTFDPALRRTALLAIAMLKDDAALAYLLAHVADSPAVHARAALEALAIYRHDPRLRAQVEAALARREDGLSLDW